MEEMRLSRTCIIPFRNLIIYIYIYGYTYYDQSYEIRLRTFFSFSRPPFSSALLSFTHRLYNDMIPMGNVFTARKTIALLLLLCTIACYWRQTNRVNHTTIYYRNVASTVIGVLITNFLLAGKWTLYIYIKYSKPIKYIRLLLTIRWRAKRFKTMLWRIRLRC